MVLFAAVTGAVSVTEPPPAHGYYMSKFLTTRKGFNKYYGRVTKIGGAILLTTGVLIATNQIQVISYYILTMFPFLTTLG